MKPTSRDEEIVQSLASDVRAMTIGQVARTWWSDTKWGRRRCKQTMQELEVEGMVSVRRVLARPIVELTSPLFAWQMEDDFLPDLDALSRSLHRRAQLSASMTDIVFASTKAVRLFGTRQPTIKLTQMTHDLQVAEVFLHHRKQAGSESWVGEDNLPKSWRARIRPDAVVMAEGEYSRAIEYGGDYSAERLYELHSAFHRIQLAYELW